MKNHPYSKILFRMILLAGIVAGCAGDSDAGKACSPNILIISADDMGYVDVSCLNPEYHDTFEMLKDKMNNSF